MSVIKNIRERSGLVVGTVAVGLILFIVGGDLLAPNSRLRGMSSQVVGEIMGREIKFSEFQAELDQTITNFSLNTGKAPSSQEMQQLREQTWNQFVFKIAFQNQFDKAGFAVTDDELVDMVQGNHIHPSIKQAFTNPQTGQFEKNSVINYLKNLDKLEPQQRAMWFNFEKSLGPDRLREKYFNLIKKSNYVTILEAKNQYVSENDKFDIQFVHVPFYSIPDSTVEVSDSRLSSFLSENKEKYKKEPYRGLDYVEFPIQPTKEDTTYYFAEMVQLLQDFSRTEDDSLFIKANSDAPYNGTFMGVSELPESFTQRVNINSMKKDSVYGPFMVSGTLKLYKLLESNNEGAETVKASHILFSTQGKTDEDKAKAKKDALDVLKRIKSGTDFAEMAAQYGSDGTSTKGGDLGWFKKGVMVAPFEQACFSGATGLLPNLVETDFGYHIVKVTQPISKSQFKLVSLERNITPGDETRELIFKKADMFASKCKTQEEFDKEAKELKLMKQNAPSVSANDNFVAGLRDAREIVRWAFNEAKKGEVSKVFELEDKYVVCTLTKVSKDGYPDLEDIREQLAFEVKNEIKAEKIIEKLKSVNGATLAEIATNYGTDAVYKTGEGLSLNNPSIAGIGFDPIVIGKAAGLSKGKKTDPFKGQNGVAILESVNVNPAPELADYSNYKLSVKNKLDGRLDNNINETIKKASDIKDNRYKFY
jgi:peptidyl-prolyl cis-trans isomerase D